jgi:transcriptional regulator with PAS, ATPase and Fis domain
MSQIQELLEAGVSKTQIAKQLGIPRTTLNSRIGSWQVQPEDEPPF